MKVGLLIRPLKNHFLDFEEVTEAPLREDLSSCIKKHFECMSQNRIYCMKSYNECSLKVLDQHHHGDQQNSGDFPF